MEKTLLFEGTKKRVTNFVLDEIANRLRKRKDYLHDLNSDDIIDFFDALVRYWKKEGYDKKYSLKNISEFLSKKNLSENLSISLRGDFHVLDKFCDLGSSQLLFHAQPRGIVVQWLAGNVSILGLFSIFSSIITKNVCLVKASSHGYEGLIDLLSTLYFVKTNAVKGEDLASCIAVVLIDRTDKENLESLSILADIRIAWGGMEAIDSIVNLKKKYYCEDILFGPKYSYGIIDKKSQKNPKNDLFRRIAIDISVFDQYACSSPHTIFVEGNLSNAQRFGEELGKQLEFINRTFLPKTEIDSGKAIDIISRRAEYELNGTVFSSKGTEWTVIVTDEEGLGQSCFSRVVYVKPIDSVKKLKKYNDRQKQTLGTELDSLKKEELLDELTLDGIDRCPNFGFMTFFEFCWDGLFIFDRLVRWVTTYKT